MFSAVITKIQLKMKKSKEGKKGTAKLKAGAGLPVVNPHAAGMDIGDTQHNVAFADGDGVVEEHEFGSTTGDLVAIVALLKSKGIKTVAMEATGVYYVAPYLLLEEAGIEPVLVNARHCKNVTGRKADDTDAVWIWKLHACGLLRRSFQPDGEFRTLREYVRQRRTLIRGNADSTRRMQKALEQMNIKAHTVISDILGKSGTAIIEAILAGERDAAALAGLCDRRIKATPEEMRKSLVGIWREEQLFLLRLAYDDYKFRLGQVKECEQRIVAQLVKQVASINGGDVTGLGSPPAAEKKKKGKAKKNQFDATLQPILKQLAGVDLCAVPGMKEVSVLELLAETGTDMSNFGTMGQYAAWANVVPNTKKTGGGTISTKMMKKKNTAGQTLRMAASTLWREKSENGDYYRRIRARSGGKAAVLATAHKLARIIYTMIKEKREYSVEQSGHDQLRYREKKIKQLERQLERLKNTA
jgi:transposase